MNYFRDLKNLFSKIKANDISARAIPLDKAISKTICLITTCSRKGNKVILIGNGGSASIASHISVDLLKNASVPALTFNDASLLTCISNDLGYEYVFERPIKMLARKGDLLIAISSSGKSKNILKAVEAALEKGCTVVTMSGFNPDNPLRTFGEINFYVPASSYGYVEISHLTICHCILDSIISQKKL